MSSSEAKEDAARALVLGGSEGIGFAQAERVARAGARILLVARRADRLAEAQAELMGIGASSVEVRAVDLADPDARQRLLATLREEGAFRSIFVGGPGPRPGREEDVEWGDHAHAQEVCITYPKDVLIHAAVLMPKGGELVILSSSASLEALDDHHFYLSALYRRELDALVEISRPRLRGTGIMLTMLRPRVVLTGLSRRYATMMGACSDRDVKSHLSAEFGVEAVPIAAEFIQRSLPAPIGFSRTCT